jgi:hypothetical protein
MRQVFTAVSILVFIVLAIGGTELGLHGPGFFTLRASGTGATGDGAAMEAQGPGQPDANGKTGCIVNADGTCLKPVQAVRHAPLLGTGRVLPAGTDLTVSCWWRHGKTMMYQVSYPGGTGSVRAADVTRLTADNVPAPVPGCPRG